MLPLVSIVEYALHALLTLEKRRDGRTDGCQIVTLRLPLDAASVMIDVHLLPSIIKQQEAVTQDSARAIEQKEPEAIKHNIQTSVGIELL